MAWKPYDTQPDKYIDVCLSCTARNCDGECYKIKALKRADRAKKSEQKKRKEGEG